MRLFPFDLLSGALLCLSLTMIALGIAVFRYRRGAGPLLLSLSGSILLIYSVLDILTTIGTLSVLALFRYAILLLSIIIGIISLIIWRR